VEAFDGRVLRRREQKGDFVVETWQPVTTADLVEVSDELVVENLPAQPTAVWAWDLEAQDIAACRKATDFTWTSTILKIPKVKLRPMPSVFLVEIPTVEERGQRRGIGSPPTSANESNR
jgi:hypothetical protein